MRPFVMDRVAWSVYRSLQSVTLVNPAKRTEPIKMPFGLWASMVNLCHDNIPEIKVVMDVTIAKIFGFLYMGCTFAPPGEYN